MPEPHYRLDDLKARWRQDPGSRLFLQLAEEHRKLGQTEEAETVLLEGLEHRPRDLTGLVALGRCRLELGKVAEATEALESVIARDPAHIVANKLLVEAHLQAGDAEPAGERLEIYKLLNDRDPEIDHLTYRLRRMRGEGDSATQAVAAPDAAGESGEAEDVVSLDELEDLEPTLEEEPEEKPPAVSSSDDFEATPWDLESFDSTPQGEASSATGDVFELDAPPSPAPLDEFWGVKEPEATPVANSSSTADSPSPAEKPTDVDASRFPEASEPEAPSEPVEASKPEEPSKPVESSPPVAPPAAAAADPFSDLAPPPEPSVAADEPFGDLFVAPSAAAPASSGDDLFGFLGSSTPASEPAGDEPAVKGPEIEAEPAFGPEPVFETEPAFEPETLSEPEPVLAFEPEDEPDLRPAVELDLQPAVDLEPAIDLEPAVDPGRVFDLEPPPSPAEPAAAAEPHSKTFDDEAFDDEAFDDDEEETAKIAVGPLRAKTAKEEAPAAEAAGEEKEEVATVTLGGLYLKQGHHEEAARTFRRVLETDPGNEAALAGLKLAEAPAETPTPETPETPETKPPRSLTAADLLAEASRDGALPAGVTARKRLLLDSYRQHLRKGRAHVR